MCSHWLIVTAFFCHAGILGAESEDKAPSPNDIRRAVVRMLRESSLADSNDAKCESLVQLCDAYVAVRLHPLYANSDILKGEAVRIRRRLISESDRLAYRLKRERIVRPAALNEHVDLAIASSSPEQASNTLDAVKASGVVEFPGNGGGAIADNGWALVELIQRTVHPDFWETTGGPGSIQYFAMKRVLVVRATTRVHEDLVALLRQL